MTSLPEALRARAAQVRVLALDVDGVLTDGLLHYGPDGEQTKAFHVRDGLGIRLLAREGIHVGVISAKRSAPLVRRLEDLGVVHAYLGREDKVRALRELLAQVGAHEHEAAFVGDDLVDIPVMARVGLPIAVADAHPRARSRALWVTRARGGHGAVREVADALLDARGRLEAACDALERELERSGS